MKYAIISDIHANREALECVLDDAARVGADEIVCLGDVVGYGPLPAETLRRVRETASVVLAGNHDDAVSGRIDAKDFIDLAGDAVLRHRETLSRDDLAWLKSLPHTATIEGATLVHGDLTAPADFNYVDTEDAARANFTATDAQLVFVGHTHVPGIYLTGQSGRIYTLGAEDFSLETGKRYIVNVGSVGYPRESNGQCFSSYVLYDSAERSVRFRQLPFAVSSVLQRGRAHRRRGLVITAITGVLLAVLALVATLRPNDRREQRPAVPVATLPSIEERTVNLDANTHALRANLKLKPGSPDAVLAIAYFDAQGRELTPFIDTCKSSTRKIKPPKDAVRAVLSVRPVSAESSPRVKSFDPKVE